MRMLRIGMSVVLALAAPVALAAQVKPDAGVRQESIALPPELDRVLREYEAAWSAGDETALAELFTDDGFVPVPSGWSRGRALIESVYENAQGPLLLRAIAFAVHDTVGYIVGAYTYRGLPEGTDAGKFLLALRLDASGRWLIAADLASSNRE
ncbi:MAG TPA: DUF4440 domain-containing protein [Longimicrobiales bacterium]|nr:DUF4440 domain-containing protein [Longimicrobiales bacterium]